MTILLPGLLMHSRIDRVHSKTLDADRVDVVTRMCAWDVERVLGAPAEALAAGRESLVWSEEEAFREGQAHALLVIGDACLHELDELHPRQPAIIVGMIHRSRERIEPRTPDWPLR